MVRLYAILRRCAWEERFSRLEVFSTGAGIGRAPDAKLCFRGRYSHHKVRLTLQCPRQQTRAREYASIATPLVYPFVRRISRFSLPRHTECSPSLRFTAPPLPATYRSGGSQARYTLGIAVVLPSIGQPFVIAPPTGCASMAAPPWASSAAAAAIASTISPRRPAAASTPRRSKSRPSPCAARAPASGPWGALWAFPC